jgi:hypothetical protein
MAAFKKRMASFYPLRATRSRRFYPLYYDLYLKKTVCF